MLSSKMNKLLYSSNAVEAGTHTHTPHTHTYTHKHTHTHTHTHKHTNTHTKTHTRTHTHARTHTHFHVHPHKTQEYLKTARPKERPNVVMIGLDAVSRHNFIRQLPKTRDFLLQKLNAIEFMG